MKKEKGKTASIKNQLNDDYQRDVIQNNLENNRGIHTFNNQSK